MILKNHITNYLFSFNAKLSLFLYLFTIITLHFGRHGIQVQTLDLVNLVYLIIGAFTCLLVPMILEYTVKSERIRRFSLLIFYTTYVFFSICHYRFGSFFDLGLALENSNLIFYKESLEIVFSRFKTKDIILFFIFTGPIFFHGFLKKKFINPSFTINRKKGFFYLCLYFLLIFSGYNRYDEVGVFTSDSFRFIFKPIKLNDYAKSILKKDFPFVKQKLTFANTNQKEKHPHIFLIPIESFNSNFIETKTRDGKFYTPFLNKLIKKGLYVENFYGNSIQTVKGFFGILCSMVPKTTGKVFVKNDKTNFYCLPEILKSRGYTNFYNQSFSSISYDNKVAFYEKNNFDKINSIDTSHLSKKERSEKVWGWGPQDDLLYEDTFKKLDKMHNDGKKKFFVSLLGVSSHMMFNYIPTNQKILFPNDKNHKEAYSNAIRLVDKYLETFFAELEKREYLKNSIVIITGDHSFPVGEHGLYHNERSFYNEFFKTPLLVLWKGKINPRRIKNKSYSQIDIAPTILDLMGLNTSNHFQGTSILTGDKVLQYLVQPYSGKYLSIIDYPLKYVFHEKSRREYLFDIVRDKMESTNLLSSELSERVKNKINFFRERLGFFYANDYIIDNNRVWKD